MNQMTFSTHAKSTKSPMPSTHPSHHTIQIFKLGCEFDLYSCNPWINHKILDIITQSFESLAIIVPLSQLWI